MTWLTDHWVEITAAATLIVGAARVIVMLTPSKKDDEWLAKVVAFLKVVGLHVEDKPQAKPEETK